LVVISIFIFVTQGRCGMAEIDDLAGRHILLMLNFLLFLVLLGWRAGQLCLRTGCLDLVRKHCALVTCTLRERGISNVRHQKGRAAFGLVSSRIPERYLLFGSTPSYERDYYLGKMCTNCVGFVFLLELP
jgi:hypothetical protein